ncbi:hypothetical protein BJV77DRAFT_1021574 [Russula vinacea]|nr:hypothetical protein BJV77DRAFT_1021574 [Russula vinacea]
MILRKAYHSPSCKAHEPFSTLSARCHFQVPISGHSPHWAIIEDYSEFSIDEDDKWQEKFADFKMKTSIRHGLFHPNDIKPIGIMPMSPIFLMLNAIGHSRTVTPTEPGTSSSGSFGRSDVQRLASQEFNKYAEDDDEDYDCLNTLCRHCSSTPGCLTSLG